MAENHSEKQFESGRVSGKLVVPLLFGGAIFVAGMVYLAGNLEKRRWDHISISSPGDSSRILAVPESIRVYLEGFPKRWVQTTLLEDRQAVVIPCFSETPSLAWEWEDTTSAARLRVLCPFCENADTLHLGSVQLSPAMASHAGPMTLFLRDDSLPLVLFPEGDSALGDLPKPHLRWKKGKDTLWFFPQDSMSRVDVLREEDENPEGCRPREGDARPPDEKDFQEVGR